MREVQRAPDTRGEERERSGNAEPRVQTSLHEQLGGLEGLDPLRKVGEGCFREVAVQYGHTYQKKKKDRAIIQQSKRA